MHSRAALFLVALAGACALAGAPARAQPQWTITQPDAAVTSSKGTWQLTQGNGVVTVDAWWQDTVEGGDTSYADIEVVDFCSAPAGAGTLIVYPTCELWGTPEPAAAPPATPIASHFKGH